MFLDELGWFEEKDMPFIAPIEQLWLEEGWAKGHQEGRQEGRLEGRQEGLRQGIEYCLKLKFGQPGLDLMPRVHALTDTTALDAIETAPDVDTRRNLLPPQT